MLALLLGLLGLLFYGVRGLLFGALIGYLLGRGLRSLIRGGLTKIQSQFTDSTFAIVGALSKADGVVTPEEIRAAEQLFVRFRLSPEQTEAAKAAFQRGKAPDFDLDAEVRIFKQAVRGNPILLQLFLDILLRTVAADGEIHAAEREMLLRICRELGLSERDLAQLEALLRSVGARASAHDAPPAANQLEDAYTALGVSPSVSDDELKRAYRKLIVENHPDKLSAKGLPASMLQMAEERTRELNAAFTLIKKARGIS